MYTNVHMYTNLVRGKYLPCYTFKRFPNNVLDFGNVILSYFFQPNRESSFICAVVISVHKTYLIHALRSTVGRLYE